MPSDAESGSWAQVREMFARAPFVVHVGIVLEALGEGRCTTGLLLEPRHLQQGGVAHAGLLATMADHTAGGAASTLLAPGLGVVSVEFKLNLLRPARGPRLRCQATVLKGGRTLSVVESEIMSIEERGDRLAAKATVTLAIVPWS